MVLLLKMSAIVLKVKCNVEDDRVALWDTRGRCRCYVLKHLANLLGHPGIFSVLEIDTLYTHTVIHTTFKSI